jgi:predicted ribosomally synthesized peptide with SipW-like signal peptide
MKLKTMAMTGMMSLAGLGLVGAGAHAVFTQNTVSSQQITAGTMNVQLSTLVPGANLSANGQTLTFAPFGPTGSSFTTGDELVTITNYSNFVVSEIMATPGDTYDSSGGPASPNSLLAAEAYLCEVSSSYVIYNGPLASAPAQAISGSLAAYPGTGNTDNYSVNIYAGTEPTACGTGTTGTTPNVPGTSTAPTLLQGAQGGVINPSMTVSYTG